MNVVAAILLFLLILYLIIKCVLSYKEDAQVLKKETGVSPVEVEMTESGAQITEP